MIGAMDINTFCGHLSYLLEVWKINTKEGQDWPEL